MEIEKETFTKTEVGPALVIIALAAVPGLACGFFSIWTEFNTAASRLLIHQFFDPLVNLIK